MGSDEVSSRKSAVETAKQSVEVCKERLAQAKARKDKTAVSAEMFNLKQARENLAYRRKLLSEARERAKKKK